MPGDITHILREFAQTPLAILPSKALAIRDMLYARASGHVASREDIERLEDDKRKRTNALWETVVAFEPKAVRRSDGVVLAGRVAVMPVFGTLSQRVGALERSSGGISTEEIGATLDGLVNDKQVRSIIMLFDSPGGSVTGVKELGDKIRAAREKKTIEGVADPLAASAALWLIAQTSHVSVSASGMIGSHGVISAHEDLSVMEEKMGIKTTLITSSPYKGEANPFAPLSQEAKAEIQSKVMHFHSMFTEALAKGRNMTENRIEKTFGQGRMLTPEQAKDVGMVDRIGGLTEALRRLGSEGPIAEDAGPAIVAEDQGPPLAARLASARVRALEVSSR